MTKTICDICGKEILRGDKSFTITIRVIEEHGDVLHSEYTYNMHQSHVTALLRKIETQFPHADESPWYD